MGSIFILNKRNALKYLRKPIHEVLDNKIIYININDNNCVHKIHNSMLMFRRNIVTYNIYFSDSLTSKTDWQQMMQLTYVGFYQPALMNAIIIRL